MQALKLHFLSRQTIKYSTGLLVGYFRKQSEAFISRSKFCFVQKKTLNSKLTLQLTRNLCSTPCGPMELDLGEVVRRIEEDAPTFLAESWDNVGLLVEPSPPHQVTRIMLTNDLTEQVLEEAITNEAKMIISYHPPIFVPLKRLTQKSIKERIIVKCIENRIAVYSPHTVYDALGDGVNNWLSQAFNCKSIVRKRPLSQKFSSGHLCRGCYRLEVTVPESSASTPAVMGDLALLIDASPMKHSTHSAGGDSVRISWNLSEEELTSAVGMLKNKHRNLLEKTEVIKLDKPPYPGAGVGLTFIIQRHTTLNEAVNLVKQHIGLQQLRLCVGSGCTMESSVKSIAVCAGSGSSVLRGAKADLYLTGEMSHHDLLDATSKGINVILCEHSNSERGFLSELSNRFKQKFHDAKMDIIVSSTDKDPVTIV